MPRRSDTKLTDKLCRGVFPPETGYRLILCSGTKGLGFRVTASGSRAFVFSFVNARGRQRRCTIGAYPEWSVVAARTRAAELRRAVDRGEDPMAQRRDARAAQTVGELWVWYEAHAFTKLASSSQRSVRDLWTRFILPSLGKNTSIKELHRSEVQRLIDRVTDQAGPTTANLTHSYLRRVLNLAVAEGWLDQNVATMAIARNPTHPRERYLKPDELSRLLDALDAIGTVPALCLRFVALTGCRKSEAMNARWNDFDLERGVWSKPASTTKARRRHVVPISGAAVDTLYATRSSTAGSGWVFPGRDPARPIRELKFTWRKAVRIAGLASVRIHDLRHSFASMIASNGGTLLDAGALLGHSQPATTARYAHLFDDRLRAATDAVADHVLLARPPTKPK